MGVNNLSNISAQQLNLWSLDRKFNGPPTVPPPSTTRQTTSLLHCFVF